MGLFQNKDMLSSINQCQKVWETAITKFIARIIFPRHFIISINLKQFWLFLIYILNN